MICRAHGLTDIHTVLLSYLVSLSKFAQTIKDLFENTNNQGTTAMVRDKLIQRRKSAEKTSKNNF
jgi:hypothetical protein